MNGKNTVFFTGEMIYKIMFLAMLCHYYCIGVDPVHWVVDTVTLGELHSSLKILTI